MCKVDNDHRTFDDDDNDKAGYDRHEDRIAHADRFCRSVYDVKTALSLDSEDANRATTAKLDAVVDAATQRRRARVTLTYAQSLDGKIAGAQRKMLALSNAESMIMTHMLRILHHGILVGIGTLLNDDPQLNARLLNPLSNGQGVPVSWLPRPIVVDTRLQTPLDCKLVRNAQKGIGKSVIVVTAAPSDKTKATALRNAGADVVEVEADENGRLRWPDVFKMLDTVYNIASVMVEGGATVIDSLLQAHVKDCVIDDLIVTVSDVHVGDAGLSYSAPTWLSDELRQTNPHAEKRKAQRFAFRNNTVVAWSLRDS